MKQDILSVRGSLKLLKAIYQQKRYRELQLFYREQEITETSHLEIVGLFDKGIGRDNISDFTTNLILDFLLKYTEAFAKKYIDASLTRQFTVNKSFFDYKYER